MYWRDAKGVSCTMCRERGVTYIRRCRRPTHCMHEFYWKIATRSSLSSDESQRERSHWWLRIGGRWLQKIWNDWCDRCENLYWLYVLLAACLRFGCYVIWLVWSVCVDTTRRRIGTHSGKYLERGGIYVYSVGECQRWLFGCCGIRFVVGWARTGR